MKKCADDVARALRKIKDPDRFFCSAHRPVSGNQSAELKTIGCISGSAQRGAFEGRWPVVDIFSG
jgi:hypothetical protein